MCTGWKDDVGSPLLPQYPHLYLEQRLSKFEHLISLLEYPRAVFTLRTHCARPPWFQEIPVSQQGLRIMKGQSPPLCADLGHRFLETSSDSSLIKAAFASPPAFFFAITLIKLIFLCSLYTICINGKFIYSVPNSPVTAL